MPPAGERQMPERNTDLETSCGYGEEELRVGAAAAVGVGGSNGIKKGDWKDLEFAMQDPRP